MAPSDTDTGALPEGVQRVAAALRAKGHPHAPVVTAGDRRVDEAKVAALVGPLGRADATFVKAKTGFSIGGVSPLAHASPCVGLIDRTLLRFELVWAAAGHPHAVFPLRPQDLADLSGSPVADVAREPVSEKMGDAMKSIAARAYLVRAAAENVPSPCSAVCRMDAGTGWCEGCFRTLDEIRLWSSADDTAKRQVWAAIEQRIAALKT